MLHTGVTDGRELGALPAAAAVADPVGACDLRTLFASAADEAAAEAAAERAAVAERRVAAEREQQRFMLMATVLVCASAVVCVAMLRN